MELYSFLSNLILSCKQYETALLLCTKMFFIPCMLRGLETVYRNCVHNTWFLMG